MTVPVTVLLARIRCMIVAKSDCTDTKRYGLTPPAVFLENILRITKL